MNVLRRLQLWQSMNLIWPARRSFMAWGMTRNMDNSRKKLRWKVLEVPSWFICNADSREQTYYWQEAHNSFQWRNYWKYSLVQSQGSASCRVFRECEGRSKNRTWGRWWQKVTCHVCQDSRIHVAGTVEHVVLCSQGTGDTAPLLLVGLNEDTFRPSMKVVYSNSKSFD